MFLFSFSTTMEPYLCVNALEAQLLIPILSNVIQSSAPHMDSLCVLGFSCLPHCEF